MANIIILLDYKGEFQCSISDLKNYTSMDLNKVVRYLKELGHSVEVMGFKDIDLSKSYKGKFVLYHSSEDPGLFYKSYIEDICLFLKFKGAILIPKFEYLRAHHNKAFMEMLRYTFQNKELKTIKSRIFGTYEDSIKEKIEFPCVIKSSEGAGGIRVGLVLDRKQFPYMSKKMSRVIYGQNIMSILKNEIYRILNNNSRIYTKYRNKFLVQTFIPGLLGDAKVLYFGGKYFLLGRKTRLNDFRASGSGRFYQISGKEANDILSLSRLLVLELGEEIVGADIGHDGEKAHLFEYQVGVFIGPYAMQCSKYWYEYDDIRGGWLKKYEKGETY